jgi:hypothetical protein
MSALWTGLIGGPADETRPRLRPVPAGSGGLARRPFAVVLIALFGLGMTGLLMLNTTLQNQAFEARALSRHATELAHLQADLETQLDQVAAPQELARRASLLDMRPNPKPAFLVLPSGKVIGKPTPVTGREMTELLPRSDAELAGEQAAADARRASQVAEQAADRRARLLERQRKATEAQAELERRAAADRRRAGSDSAGTAEPEPEAPTKKPSSNGDR